MKNNIYIILELCKDFLEEIRDIRIGFKFWYFYLVLVWIVLKKLFLNKVNFFEY